jgi:hypothetical protein
MLECLPEPTTLAKCYVAFQLLRRDHPNLFVSDASFKVTLTRFARERTCGVTEGVFTNRAGKLRYRPRRLPVAVSLGLASWLDNEFGHLAVRTCNRITQQRQSEAESRRLVVEAFADGGT